MSPISAQDLQSKPTKSKSIVLQQMQVPFLTCHRTLATLAAPEPLSLRHQNYSYPAVLPRGQPTTNAVAESEEGRLIWGCSEFRRKAARHSCDTQDTCSRTSVNLFVLDYPCNWPRLDKGLTCH